MKSLILLASEYLWIFQNNHGILLSSRTLRQPINMEPTENYPGTSESQEAHDSDEVDFTKMDQAKGIDRPDDRPDEESSPKSPGNIFDKMSR